MTWVLLGFSSCCVRYWVCNRYYVLVFVCCIWFRCCGGFEFEEKLINRIGCLDLSLFTCCVFAGEEFRVFFCLIG